MSDYWQEDDEPLQQSLIAYAESLKTFLSMS